MDNIIIIQKNIRGYLVRKKELIANSYYQTKQWRNNRKWYKNGKSNECEKYQINILEKIIKIEIKKTNCRINMIDNIMENIKHPMKNKNGYEYTENFDGYFINKNNNYYINLKFVCDEGGAQTRTLREVYHFIKNQIKILEKENNIYFINILDGDTSNKNMDKFNYLMENINTKIKNKLFIGDLYEFQNKKHLYNL
jgi:hypothetical protein